MRLIKYDNFWNDPFVDFEPWINRVFGSSGFMGERSNAEPTGGFRIDTFTSDDAHHVVAELPGVPKEAINVTLENAVLTISGSHSTGSGEQRRKTQFSRSVTVGDHVDATQVTAKYENGLLTVTLPKAEERRPKAITVN